eukprot:TRINITY_DN81829_c0_g1_i1.p1 TRINITY_DN81829_c0_g1~~TRINITY_DN81829_c0_g1_i1.p1  ORF type:complete len:301 (+),score=85.59 TRINITY_DN81829_c0_g1_i1:97-903(+)
MATDEVPVCGEGQVIDGLPLIEAGTQCKEQGNDFIKKKEYDNAVIAYKNGIDVLDKAAGHPMLREEVEQMIALKAVLYCNTAQALLHKELYRRAAEAATECLQLDPENQKALHRRSLAYEHIKSWGPALEDVLALMRLGGAGMSVESLENRAKKLREKKEEEERLQREDDEEKASDPIGMTMVHMKERFDEVIDKYDLRDGSAAEELADWLTSGEWGDVGPKRVANRWGMEYEDAEVFLGWIAQGLEFKIQNAEAQGQAQAAAPRLDN